MTALCSRGVQDQGVTFLVSSVNGVATKENAGMKSRNQLQIPRNDCICLMFVGTGVLNKLSNLSWARCIPSCETFVPQ